MEDNKFKAARKASNLTCEQAASITELGVSTYPLRERKPDDFRLRELRKLYLELSDTAKPILKDAVDEFFCT